MFIPIPSGRPEQPKTEQIPENEQNDGVFLFFRDYVVSPRFFTSFFAGIGADLQKDPNCYTLATLSHPYKNHTTSEPVLTLPPLCVWG